MKGRSSFLHVRADVKLIESFDEAIANVNKDPLKPKVTKSSIVRDAIIKFIKGK